MQAEGDGVTVIVTLKEDAFVAGDSDGDVRRILARLLANI